jgi:hypothetical protein
MGLNWTVDMPWCLFKEEMNEEIVSKVEAKARHSIMLRRTVNSSTTIKPSIQPWQCDLHGWIAVKKPLDRSALPAMVAISRDCYSKIVLAGRKNDELATVMRVSRCFL